MRIGQAQRAWRQLDTKRSASNCHCDRPFCTASAQAMRLILDARTELDISLPNDNEQEEHAALAA